MQVVTERKKCKGCGVEFDPKLKGQQRCIPCIMKKEPERPKEFTDRLTATDFVEWFIYQWRTIRSVAAEKYGLTSDEERGTNNGERKVDQDCNRRF